MVTLNIDGHVIAVEPGTTILEAATQEGINIPTLCYDKRLSPHGACFLCSVEAKKNGAKRSCPLV
jgi:NADH dehydrogenase/NADH:ubiquinone oxidoreductase subunit G